MTQYKNEVEKQRKLLEYEEWAEQWNHIYIENGEMTIYYNSGRIVKEGVEIEPAKNWEENYRRMEQEKDELHRR
jgi:hypothetical protein